MAKGVESNENGIPFSNDGQQVFLQTQNSSDFPNSEDDYLYFSDLNNKGEADAGALKLEELVQLPTPIGLKLQKTHSLAELIEMRLNGDTDQERRRFRAKHFPLSLLKIGSFNIVATHKEHLVAKCYYSLRKLEWEIIDKGFKNKIEVLWHNILSMRAIFHDDRPGILEIELDKQPAFYHATDPMPRKHTIWEAAQDFTGGQALTYRRHYLEFPSAVFDKYHIQCDNLLLQLSQRPFPSLSSPYFDSPPLLYQEDKDCTYGTKTNASNHQEPALNDNVVACPIDMEAVYENLGDITDNVGLPDRDSEFQMTRVMLSSINPGDAFTFGSEEHYSPSNANYAELMHMHREPFGESGLGFNTQALHYIPPLQVSNENTETTLPGPHTPDTLLEHDDRLKL